MYNWVEFAFRNILIFCCVYILVIVACAMVVEFFACMEEVMVSKPPTCIITVGVFEFWYGVWRDVKGILGNSQEWVLKYIKNL